MRRDLALYDLARKEKSWGDGPLLTIPFTKRLPFGTLSLALARYGQDI